jgi:hypothetical protein
MPMMMAGIDEDLSVTRCDQVLRGVHDTKFALFLYCLHIDDSACGLEAAILAGVGPHTAIIGSAAAAEWMMSVVHCTVSACMFQESVGNKANASL